MSIAPTAKGYVFRAGRGRPMAREVVDFATGQPPATGRHAPSSDVADPPLSNVAALLIAIAQNNSCEGRDPKAMPEGLTSGFVADLLGVDIAMLAALLHDLRRRGLIDCAASSATIRLKDVDALRRLVS